MTINDALTYAGIGLGVLAAIEVAARRIVALTPTKKDDEVLDLLTPYIDKLEAIGAQIIPQTAAAAATGAATGAAAAVAAAPAAK